MNNLKGPIILDNGLGTPAIPGSYFGFGQTAPETDANSSGPRVYSGTGNPNGVLTAPIGSLWLEFVTGIVYRNTNSGTTWSVLAPDTQIIPDPGTGAVIPVTRSGSIALTIGAGAETNTLAIPLWVGQRLTIYADTVGAGTRAITSAQPINGAGNTIMTFNATFDFLTLQGITIGGAFHWAVAANNSVVLT